MVGCTLGVLLFSGLQGMKAYSLSMGAISAVLYFSNWVRAFWHDVDIYGHTWSLSVEEQFYILWALLLPWCLRKITFGKTRGLVLCLIATAIIWRVCLFMAGATQDRLYNGFDTHVDGCLTGCALALFLVKDNCRVAVRSVLQHLTILGPVAFCCLIGLAFFATVLNRSTSILWISPLISLLSTIIICDVVIKPGVLRTLLSNRFVVHLGVISYGIYLWHYPLIIGLGYAPDRIPQTPLSELVVGTVGTIVISEASYWLLELPCLRLKKKFSQGTDAAPGTPDRL
jgi:peptidoglycan/LPS O-acetylase OafA/YrhL